MSKISAKARKELVAAVAERYQTGTATEKGCILDEFTALTGCHRKHAIRVLSGNAPKLPGRRGRRGLYDQAVTEALVVLWEASDRVCGKRLKALLPILVPALERHGHLDLDPQVREQLMAVSATTIDRRLAEARSVTAGRRRRRSAQNGVRGRVPVRTFADWQDPSPGFVEADLVAHCGGAMAGSFVWSLVVTDIASGWTDCAVLLVREGSLVVEALDQLRKALPFPLRGLDTDNGSEFLNDMLISYCSDQGIELTRSRPYRKNDQAWVEQKNGAVVRRLVGYGRLEGVAAAATLARLYSASRLFVNVFQPAFKLAEKTREGARVRKRYHPPETPCARLLASDAIPAATKDRLGALLGTLDPLGLLDEIRTVQHHLAALAAGSDGPADAATRCRTRPLPAQPGTRLARWGSAADSPARGETATLVAHPARPVRDDLAPRGAVAGGRAAAHSEGTLRASAAGASRPVCSGPVADPATAGQGLAPTRGPSADPGRSDGTAYGCGYVTGCCCRYARPRCRTRCGARRFRSGRMRSPDQRISLRRSLHMPQRPVTDVVFDAFPVVGALARPPPLRPFAEGWSIATISNGCFSKRSRT